MKEMENYAGDSVFISEEKLKRSERIIFSMVKLCNRLTKLHDMANEKKKSMVLLEYEDLEKTTKKICEQYRNRATGDNGLANNLIMLNNSLEIWQQKLELATQSSEVINKQKLDKLKITNADWTVFYQSIDEWIDHARKAMLSTGNPLKEIDELKPGVVVVKDSEM